MSEREADRQQPARMKAQAVIALVKEGSVISPEFKQQLLRHDQQRSLFGLSELARIGGSSLESEIVQSLQAEPALAANGALKAALRARVEAYVREQKCQLIADRESCVTEATQSVRKACHDAVSEAAALILSDQGLPAHANRVQLNENLLAHVVTGGLR